VSTDTRPVGGNPSRAARGMWVLAALLTLVLASPAAGTALAAEPTSSYPQTPPPPPEAPKVVPNNTQTKSSPSTEVVKPREPEKPKEPETPAASSEPRKARYAQAPVSEHHGSSTALPFTGFDVRWELGVGLAMIGVGLTIVATQRRRRRARGRSD
jgi:outer membrane biosynthesis protein TonB